MKATKSHHDDSLRSRGYELPFRFTGTIDKLTFKLGPSQMAAADRKAQQAAYRKVND